MRTQLTTTILFCLLSSNVPAAEQTPLADEADRINYTIGHQIGSDFKRQQIDLDEQALKQGIQDGRTDTTPLLDRKEMDATLQDLKRKITTEMKERSLARVQARKRDAEEKRSRGKAFLQENQTRAGVKTMPSGLQYRVLTNGAGPKPKADDYVTFHYRAKTLSGKEYDSSFKKGKPSTYRANGVLPGFTEAIQMMQPGAKWELYIPPELAYGRQGPLAHQTVIIDVELISFEDQKKKEQQQIAE